jgi:hypothetical protein
MPLCPKRLNNRIRNRLPTPLTLRTIPMRMAIHTPRIPILLHKRRTTIKRIATLRTKEVSSMPLRSTRDDNLTFDRCLAALAPRTEELVEIEVAVEA